MERKGIMKKNLKKKLSLNRETLHALADGALRNAAGGVVTANTCGTPCSAACSDVCTDRCPTQVGPHCTL
jgi:hypothetical protein